MSGGRFLVVLMLTGVAGCTSVPGRPPSFVTEQIRAAEGRLPLEAFK